MDAPSFPQLTPDPRPWRIDWFGEVTYPGAVRRYTQPCIKIAVSPLTNYHPASDGHLQIETDVRDQQQIWMPVGSLPMLQIGDIWQDGRLLTEPKYTSESFEFDLTKHPATPIKAGVSIRHDHLLPFPEHPWHVNHTHSYCLSVPIDEARTLIVPGAEMIRFYFGSSSKLIHRLFTAPFSEAALYRERHYNPDTGHLHLKLTERMNKAGAQDIGRIAQDEHARQAAAAVYGNCVKATSRGESAYPYIGFPFMGRTKLYVQGVWLSFQGKAERTFLAFSIRSCLHPFPFRSLSFDNPSGKRNPGKGKPGTGDNDRQSPYVVSKPKKTALDGADPGNRKKWREIALERRTRFPDLLNKPVWQQQVILLGAEEVYCRHDDGSIEKVSFGEPTAAGEARPIDVALGGTSLVAINGDVELPRFVRQGIRSACDGLPSRGCELEAKPLLVDGRSEPVFPLPMVLDEDGVIDPTPMFTEPNGHQRMRRVCFVGFYDGGKEKHQFVLVEGQQVTSNGTVLEVEGQTDILEVVTHLCERRI